MPIQLRNNQLSIKDIVIENELVAEYLSSLPASEREAAVIRALGIGIMAEMKGEISHMDPATTPRSTRTSDQKHQQQ